MRRKNVPPPLLQHLLDRIQDRRIPATRLERLTRWLDSEPEVPEGPWYKRFAGMTVCGEGELVKTSGEDVLTTWAEPKENERLLT